MINRERLKQCFKKFITQLRLEKYIVNFKTLCFRRYFDNGFPLSSKRNITTLTPPQKYPGRSFSFEDQCKLVSSKFSYFPRVRNT